MKKIVWTIIMVLLMTTVFAGCSKKAGGEISSSKDEIPTTTETLKQNEEEDSEQQDTTTEVQAETSEEDKEPVTEEVVLDDSTAVKMWTTASSLNLRKTPDASGVVLKVLKHGTEILKYEELDGWALVKAEDLYGYVSMKYIADEKPEEPTTSKKEETTASKVEAIPGQHRNPNSAVVVIDPGHQRKGDSTKEPNGPGSSVMKARVTYGTTGVATGVTEYILNLDVSMKLRTELQNRGYTVYMTRTSHDVNMSNKERAEYGNSVGADAVIRIHANSSDNSSVRGAETLSPSSSNTYVGHLAAASQKLGKCVIDAYCKATGFKNRGMKTDDTMTGINWSQIPVTIIELGFMSNAEEDKAMQDSNMQNNMVQGIANGLDAYFGF